MTEHVMVGLKIWYAVLWTALLWNVAALVWNVVVPSPMAFLSLAGVVLVLWSIRTHRQTMAGQRLPEQRHYYPLTNTTVVRKQ